MWICITLVSMTITRFHSEKSIVKPTRTWSWDGRHDVTCWRLGKKKKYQQNLYQRCVGGFRFGDPYNGNRESRTEAQVKQSVCQMLKTTGSDKFDEDREID